MAPKKHALPKAPNPSLTSVARILVNAGENDTWASFWPTAIQELPNGKFPTINSPFGARARPAPPTL